MWLLGIELRISERAVFLTAGHLSSPEVRFHTLKMRRAFQEACVLLILPCLVSLLGEPEEAQVLSLFTLLQKDLRASILT